MAQLNINNSTAFALRDQHHAAKTFTSSAGYPLAPYHGFLFHVFLEFNSVASANRYDETKTVSVLIKAADLPKFKMQTETLNQYNRKRLVHTKIEYDPIRLVLRDDVANHVRNIWIDYHSYNTNDPNIGPLIYSTGGVYNERMGLSFGLDASAAAVNEISHIPLLRSVQIFSMGNHQYSRMQLINPVIVSADFDSHDYSEGGKTMELTLGIEYESVLYSTGDTKEIGSFGENNSEYYDTGSSNLAPANLDRPDSTLVSRAPQKGPLPQAPDVFLTPRTALQQAATQIDAVAGNVSSQLRGQTRFTERQFFEVLRDTVSSTSRSRSPFVFPVADAITDQSRLVELESREQLERSEIASGINVTSNGVSVTTSAVQRNARITALGTAQTSIDVAIQIDPRIPPGLTPAERVLFKRSFPRLPSTDPRSRVPPYVG